MNTSVHSKYLVKGDGHMCNITNIHNCEVCGKEITDEDTIIMNRRYHGSTERYLCKEHLKRSLSISEKLWSKIIEGVKRG